jgi:uncharacterized protein YqeY
MTNDELRMKTYMAEQSFTQYMPASVTEEEIRSLVESIIAETGAKTVKDMGMVMKARMARFAGHPLDGRKVNELVKAKLQQPVASRQRRLRRSRIE